MRLLAIDEGVEARVKEVRRFAGEKENWYRPFAGVDEKLRVPGDDERYVVHIEDGYRAVFSITEDPEGRMWRQLSVSVPGGKYPHPVAVWTIAELFGFEGWDGRSEMPPKGWMFRKDDGAGERCIVVGTRYLVRKGEW